MLETMNRRIAAGLLPVLLAAAAPVWAQDDSEPVAVFRSDSRLVVLHATVLDRQGDRITNLPQSAFHVFENGAAQEIKIFRREDAPVSIGLIVDDSGSMIAKRERVAAAAMALIKASHPDDEVFVLHFNEKAYLDSDFTSDQGQLERALKTSDSRNATAMRDALRLAIVHAERRAREDKKVLVVVTDGEDNTSTTGHDYIVKAAQQSGVLIYAIGILGEEGIDSTRRARRDLDALTKATGGQAYYLNNVSEATATATEIAREVRDQYTIAYTPTSGRQDGTYRKIEVTAEGPNGLVVRTRSGYYARGERSAANSPPADRAR
jgi:Ca-activated chloride channel family protein